MLDAGPGLTLLDEAEGVKAVLGVGDGKAFLEFWGEDSRSNVTLSMEGNQPELSFYDSAGRCRAALELTADGPCLRLFDSSCKCRAMMDLDGNGEPSVVVYDDDGEETQRLPE